MSDRVRLVLLSFLMLLVELALIRWTGSNVVYLSYFSNFVLLGSFLGIGAGFLRAHARVDLFRWAPVVLAAFVVFVRAFPVEIDRSGSQLIYFGALNRTGLPTWLTLPVIFGAVATTMMMIAEGVARTFVKFEPLEAYRLDILGSLAGIVAFSLLSFAHAPPLAWGLVAGAVFVALNGRTTTLLQAVAILSTLGLLTDESLRSSDSWSPYYRVSVLDKQVPGEHAYLINVNGVPHQTVESVGARQRHEPLYFLPYQHAVGPRLDQVLVVGAGNGSDVAIALAQGARHVDAVEIDPRLYQIGVELNPDRPYQDSRVSKQIDDGRAFLERTDKRYDMILFALPDSLTLVAGQSSLRLESYLFTLDAMRTARRHLNPDGIFATYNYYREPWLLDRLARTLEHVYGRPPCLDIAMGVGHFAALTTSVDPDAVECPTTWKPSGANVPAPSTDDHPFLYLRSGRIPGFYGITLGLILAASVLLVRLASGERRPIRREYADLFFMGAAFLLLETKNVVQFALLFGTTWFVNALVFAGILLAVLGAIEVARRVTIGRPGRLYAALMAALGIAWVVPGHALLKLPFAPRFVLAVAIAFAPIFLANLVFAQRFKEVGSSSVAFGTNLLGAMVGGILEYGALVVGYRALLLAVAALYGLAFLSGRHRLVGVPLDRS